MNDFEDIISEYREVGITLSVEKIDDADCYRLNMDSRELILPYSVINTTNQNELVNYIVDYFTVKKK